MKKRGILAALLVGVLALAAIGGTIFAQTATPSGTPQPNNGSSGSSPQNTIYQDFISKLASILGVNQQTVQNAVQQAAKQVQDDRMQQRLNQMVQNGQITQAQANQYLQWYESRPSFAGLGSGLGGFGRMLGPGFGRHGGMKFRFGPPSQRQQTPSGTPTPSGASFTF